MRPEIRLTPPRRARRRMAGFVIPSKTKVSIVNREGGIEFLEQIVEVFEAEGGREDLRMLSRRILRWRLAPPFPRPLPPFPRPKHNVSSVTTQKKNKFRDKME